jgi:DNA-binding transcriptional MocR family regulator
VGHNRSVPPSFKYQQIADHLARGIQRGLVRPGERLPSLRSICRSHGASLMTAVAAYRRLEDLGLVEALPRSGYRVRPHPAPTMLRPPIQRPRLAPYRTERAELIARVLEAMADPALVPLGHGCPSAELFPVAAFRRITARLLRSHRNLWASYSSSRGDPELRRLIAQRYQARGMDVQADDVLITAGAMEGLSLSLRRVLDPGDLVAVECPTFFGIVDAARNSGARVIELPSDPQGGLDPDRLDAICRKHTIRAAVLMPTFANPTGSLMDDDRKAACMRVLEAHGVALVEDDVYGELAWDGRRHAPLSAFGRNDDQPNVLVGSFSKSLLPGGRLGYVIAQSTWIEGLTDLKNTSTLANATLPQSLAAECLASGVFDRHLRRLVPRLQMGVHSLRDRVARHFPPGTRISDPKGGYFLWVELPSGKGTDGLSLFHAALEQGIGIAPGCLFSLGVGLDRFVRLNAALIGDLESPIATLGRIAASVSAQPIRT